MEFTYTISGFFVGFLVGLTGVGGGSLMTPLLVFMFGITPVKAVGTDLLFAALTKAGGAIVHSRRGSVDWRVVKLLAMGSLPASLVTMYILKQLGPSPQLNQFITTGLAVALILTSVSLLFKGSFHAFGLQLKKAHPGWAQWREAVTICCGVLLGILVTMTSVGAGALGAAMLFFLYPGLPTVRIVGTDIAHAVPLTAIAGAGHLYLGNVDLVLLASLLLGSLPGIYFGSHLSANIPEKVMRPVLASMLMVIAIKFIW